jgi:putative transposase
VCEEIGQLKVEIDWLYLRRPFYGAPRVTDWLQKLGHAVNHKRVERLWRTVKYEDIYLRDYADGAELR